MTNVTNSGPSAAATASGNKLTLSNATITIDPVAYDGAYTTIAHRNVSPGFFRNVQSIVLVPELTFYIDNANGAFDKYSPGGDSGATFFIISLNASGEIASVLNAVTPHPASGAATADGQVLTFNNAPITFATNDYTGRYVLTSFRVFDPSSSRGREH